MKVKNNAAPLRRRILPSVLVGMLLCEAVPAALAQAAATDSLSAGTRVLEMFRGEVRILHIPGTIKRIAIGNGKLLTANVVDGSLMLLGEQDGITSLVVWNDKGIALQTTVRIAKAEVNASLEQLRAVLKSVAGLRIDAIGSSIVLSGVIHRDMAGIVKAATQDMKNVVDTTTVDEGDALRKTVHFKVQIMEVTRTGQRNLGIAWDSAFKGPQIGGAASVATGAAKAVTAGTSYFLAGIASNITSQINFAVENGDAYVLAAPELNTKSGGTASFLAGGQVPIPQSGALGTTSIEYKDYGIKLSIVPVVDANNIISAHLTTEISQIDPSVTYAGMPGFLTRNTSSDISMRAGETLAISGLVSADAANGSNGMPFLSQVPIIGQLFRSDSFRAKKSDLVIFVTPVISDPELSPNTDLLARADKLDENFRKEYGNTDPLVADEDKAKHVTTPRQPILTTPALLPAPIRSTPQVQAVPQVSASVAASAESPAQVPLPLSPQTPARVPSQIPAHATAQISAQAPAPTQAADTPAQVPSPRPPQPPASTPPAGVAEALRMLTDTQHAQAAPARDAMQPASNGKVPQQQIGVLGTSNN
ncbi:Flp pilus assembly protein, secretin CpaC [Burkholderia sp. Ch1-1]|uniref:Flp pilus assembly protein, secretin CpaC n=1 Tax=Paraburkholderia dioscoreae TaxID=2604047 RepID=A0A5Q4ZJ19_9BURK|nr:pilus assembly protein N-terminal domain-containing protein [Paraburkholderia dioscoreae]EIF35538.1 Flp pilus assembly protein, secretin CpaC [Burkholderia sp. Ch1-1]VVD31436.1 Flp pilus assembly protein, secretin CpaC [Paraburkholderia dioscoreae]